MSSSAGLGELTAEVCLHIQVTFQLLTGYPINQKVWVSPVILQGAGGLVVHWKMGKLEKLLLNPGETEGTGQGRTC